MDKATARPWHSCRAFQPLVFYDVASGKVTARLSDAAQSAVQPSTAALCNLQHKQSPPVLPAFAQARLHMHPIFPVPCPKLISPLLCPQESVPPGSASLVNKAEAEVGRGRGQPQQTCSPCSRQMLVLALAPHALFNNQWARDGNREQQT